MEKNVFVNINNTTCLLFATIFCQKIHSWETL